MANETWTTREGRVVKVKDMGVDHMHRCVHMVARTRSVGALMLLDSISALRYAQGAPDGAADAARDEAEALIDAAYSREVGELRLEYAIKHSKPVAAMVRRLKKARVDIFQTPPPYNPRAAKSEVSA